MYDSSVCMSLLAYDLGKAGMAFEMFDRAYEERDSLLPGLNVFPEYGQMRQEPRFQTLLKKMELDQ